MIEPNQAELCKEIQQRSNDKLTIKLEGGYGNGELMYFVFSRPSTHFVGSSAAKQIEVRTTSPSHLIINQLYPLYYNNTKVRTKRFNYDNYVFLADLVDDIVAHVDRNWYIRM
jgi:hypothetical protein